MSEAKMSNRKGLQIIKKVNNKSNKDNKMQNENTQNSQNISQINENLPKENTKEQNYTVGYKVITFIGKIDDKSPSSNYTISKNIKIPNLTLKGGAFLNMTTCLIENLKDKNTDFVFFATKGVKEYCENLLYNLKNEQKSIEDFDENKLDDLFLRLTQIIKDTRDKNIIIDITHGFRDTAFVSLLSGLMQYSFNGANHINFIYAKMMGGDNFQIVSLDNYSNTMRLSFALTTFSQNLKVIYFDDINDKFYIALKNLSNSLFENKLQAIKENYLRLKKEKEKIETNKQSPLYPLLPMINDIFNELKEFEEFNFEKAKYNNKIKITSHANDFFILAKLFLNKSYSLNAAGFILEGLQYGFYLHFVDDDLDLKHYFKTQASGMTIRNLYEGYNEIKSDEKVAEFIKIIFNTRDGIADIRNSMSHCDPIFNHAKIPEAINNLLEKTKKIFTEEGGLDKLSQYKKIINSQIKANIQIIKNKQKSNWKKSK